jgi:hypothetical protein
VSKKSLLFLLIAAVTVLGLKFPGAAQDKTSGTLANGPAKIVSEILILPEQVVEEQWPVTLETVNAPKELTQVEPGQCVRFGIVATGNGREQLLKGAKVKFELKISDTATVLPADLAPVVKQIKPEGNDFVTQVLASADIKNPVTSLASLAASNGRWCAPADVRDGTASVQGTATLPGGKDVELKRRKFEIRTFESARKKASFKSIQDMGDWPVHYHDAPDPALLLPALRLVANDDRARNLMNLTAFFVAAFKASPVAAEELMQRLPKEDRWTRLIGTAVLGWAGYRTAALRDSLDPQDKAMLEAVKFPDAYAVIPDRDVGNRQDMLWAMFFATGRIEPVRAISGALAWKEDYDKLMEHGRQARASGEKPSTDVPEYTFRAVAYGAAGWSMSSLASRDPLLLDYVEALKASPETPPAVKKELANLFTNPAFKYPAGQDQK